MSVDDLGDVSMFELFRMEAETGTEVLTTALLALERNHAAADQLDLCMRGAHSLKGAAAIVGITAAVRVAHAMEDCFVATKKGQLTLGQSHIDRLLAATDLLARIANSPEQDLDQWNEQPDVASCLASLADVLNTNAGVLTEATSASRTSKSAESPDEFVQRGESTGESESVVQTFRPRSPGDLAAGETPARRAEALAEAVRSGNAPGAEPAVQAPVPGPWVGRPSTPLRASETSDRVLRVTAEKLNRLIGLAGESLVESRWLTPFTKSVLRLKRLHHESCHALDGLREVLSSHTLDERSAGALAEAHRAALACQDVLAERLLELEIFESRSQSLSRRLYDEALACRMRPFADGVQGFPRMVRDLGQSLGKHVTLEIHGETTQVDRDILVKLDAPLGHLLRNAIDHGIESPEDRLAAGKPAQGVVRLEARHSAGTLQVTVSDDGRGVDLQKMREAIVRRNLINREGAEALSEQELLEFLFLPGFTMKSTVTDVSGRGVGLDAVQDMVRQVRGTVRISSQLGKGTRFVLQLPVTLSVLRTLLAEIGGEPYAFPLTSIRRAFKLSKTAIEPLEGRQHFDFDGRRVGLVTAHQVLGAKDSSSITDDLSVIVLGDHTHTYGLVVDRFLGERELVVQPLATQLGKIKDISAGAVMEDGSPVLIVDTDDLIRSMDRLVATGGLSTVSRDASIKGEKKRKRVLVVDDSLTVRELERKLLGSHGYEVEAAVDGMDGWNAVRTGNFDLVVTDIDMPRMDGIELVTLINRDPHLSSMPVMVVSYKDRDEDRRRGLEAGAAYYLAKGSFHDEALLQAVVDLIGEAAA